MRKKINIITISILIIFTAIIGVKAYVYDGTFALTYGKSHISDSKKLHYNYPYIILYNDDKTLDSEIAVTLQKRNFFLIYENVTRHQIETYNKEIINLDYKNYGNGTYRAVSVANRGSVAFHYFMSSSEIWF